MDIRPAIHSDLNAVTQCAHDAYVKYVERIGKKPAPMAADFAAQIRAGHLYVMEDQTQIMGFIVFYPADGALHIENIAVLPTAQGKGCGTRLLAFAEQAAKEQGFDTLDLYTNEKMSENIRYYRRRGYIETGRREQDGFQRIFYRKTR